MWLVGVAISRGWTSAGDKVDKTLHPTRIEEARFQARTDFEGAGCKTTTSHITGFIGERNAADGLDSGKWALCSPVIHEDSARSPLRRSFFQRHHLDVARDLVGTTLAWNGCSGIVVETESYAVEGDAACHTASRPSTREFVAKMPAGTAYVYLNYGMYWLVNALVKGGDADGIVLIRALQPQSGIETMRQRRGRDKLSDLCSGPGKLSMALDIDGDDHGTDLTSDSLEKHRGFLARDPKWNTQVVDDVRIGISKATDYRWRFLAADNPYVSVKLKCK